MTVTLALEYIPRRMKELGYSNAYTIRFRHLVLLAGERRVLTADGEIWILVNAADDIAVESEFGIYDPLHKAINELQYEHQGQIGVRNYSTQQQAVQFIQLIPETDNTCQ